MKFGTAILQIMSFQGNVFDFFNVKNDDEIQDGRHLWVKQ